MPTLNDIKQPIAVEWNDFEALFSTVFQSTDTLLNTALQYVHRRLGKQIRPLLTLLAAKTVGNIGHATHLAATALEVLHTASLLHDDVVDAANERRGMPSVNSRFDNRTAVLVGDYLLTKSMDYIAQTRHQELLQCLVELGKEITRGELLQLQYAYRQPTEANYYEIIRRKTAILFAICMQAGAISVGASPEQSAQLYAFGENLGICFQIKDDIFDYTPQAQVGKPTLNDLREGKFTLPIIYAMKQQPEAEAAHIVEIAKNSDFIEKNSEFLYQFVAQNGGIEYAQQQMGYFRRKAIACLEDFADSAAKKSLFDILDFVLQRPN
ncbi:MAG: polyprenyl synthetase family protein [Paludibacteraceae bacterium]